MKKFIYSFILVVSVAFVFSCADDSLDPLLQKQIKKGTILALRGTQLDNLYNKGVPGAEIFPKIMTGTETFVFEAEYLSEDVSSLSSVDAFVIKKTGSTRTRVAMGTVDGSTFAVSTYKGPSAKFTYTIVQTLAALGLPVYSDPIYKVTAGNPLLTTYQPGINFEFDINMKDGTKVSSDQIVAAGLFQSNQFYPAQLLTWTMTDYCVYDNSTWGGKTYESVETPGSTEDNKLTQDGTNLNKFTMDNWWGDGVDVYIIFSPSTNPGDQKITIPSQTTSEAGVASGTGTYNQCRGTISLNCKYVLGGATYIFLYALTPK